MGGAENRLKGPFALLWTPRELYLALGLTLWLACYFVTDGYHQFKVWWWLLPILVLNTDLLVRTVRETRWLWAVALLLAYQSLSRSWAGSPRELVGTAFDVAVVMTIVTGLVQVGRREGTGARIVAVLALLAVGVALNSLISFYLVRDHTFGEDRLRNIFIYGSGLNAVLTGMLFGFAALGVAWSTRRNEWLLRRNAGLVCLAILVFALMAAQSRGAMLAFGSGLVVMAWFARARMWPALATVAVTVGAYFLVVWRLGTPGDLVERGSTGRFEIYEWFLERMTLPEVLVGKGMGTPAEIPADQFDWFVHHPHSSYLTQFLLTGAIGLGLLIVVVGWAGRVAWQEAIRGNPFWLALIGSGAVATIFDCAQIFSVRSVPRLELLLVAVPCALLIGLVEGER